MIDDDDDWRYREMIEERMREEGIVIDDDDWRYREMIEERMREEVSMHGWMSGRAVDLDGKPVNRTKLSHPYSYDGFVLWRRGRNEDIDHCVYTDRMQQWDSDKYSRLYKDHMECRRFDNARPDAIQAFLSAYNDDPGLVLIAVMEWCNWATGYPTWSLHYKLGPKAAAELEKTE